MIGFLKPRKIAGGGKELPKRFRDNAGATEKLFVGCARKITFTQFL
jgi:hypothetical protein